MSYMELTKDGDVHILTLTNGAEENRLTIDVINEYLTNLDAVESYEGSTALVVVSSDPKFWNNGIHLDWLRSQPEGSVPNFGKFMDKLYLRMALLSCPTIGCLNGHTYAGGAILAACFDFRFMRADRGFFCFPEVDINIPFSPVMHAVLELMPDRLAMSEMMLTGKRIGGIEAQEKKIVMAAYPQEELWDKTMEWARMMAKKNRQTYASIKCGMKPRLMEYWKNRQD
ncbi:MAG: enoyl-CoA hydratase/isomerase family protein [Deltaproteobacteria bacterium]|nr:enoyl-CoA hydratase/isomerase family protein [Deltaproteobacteria bacterium]